MWLFIILMVARVFSSNTDVNLEMSEKPIFQVDDKFLSVTLDSNTIRRGWLNFDMNSLRIKTLAKGLAPSFFRVGGTEADFLIFDEETNEIVDNSLDFLTRSHEDHYNFTLSTSDWELLNSFVVEVGWDLIFDLNVLLRTNEDIWDTSNAEKLINFSFAHNFSLDWQLGNEPNHFPHSVNRTVNSTQLARDFGILRNLLDVSGYKESKVVGPDITHPYARGKDLGTLAEIYLDDFLSSGAVNHIDAVTWHQYYFSGQTAKAEDFLNITIMDQLASQIKIVSEVVQRYDDKMPIYLGETAGACGGGAQDLSGTYISGFLWLDKLGISAASGLTAVMRQTFFHGRYGLLDDNVNPRPDYWLSFLYKALVGSQVFDLMTSSPEVRMYAHCASSRVSEEGSAILLYGMNLMESSVNVILPSWIREVTVHEYLLSPCNGNLNDTCVMLNHEPLVMVDDAHLPSLHGKLVDTIILPPKRYGFWFIEKPDYFPYCQQ